MEVLFPDNSLIIDFVESVKYNNKLAMYRILDDLTNSTMIDIIKTIEENDEYSKDAISVGQIKSKQWVIEQLELAGVPLGTVFLCAGWYGLLATMIFESSLSVEKIRSFDIDESCADIADTINRTYVNDQWRFKAITADMHNVNYHTHEWSVWSIKNNRMSYTITDSPDTIINTSCEHIVNFDDWFNSIPNGKLVILQSNDFFEVDDHVNCSHNLQEFSLSAPMTTVLYEGELDLPKYKRFMKIGYK
jgi:hypothetical protein